MFIRTTNQLISTQINQDMNKETAQRLFNFMRNEYLVELTETDMQEIERILSEGKKARKHNSPKLQEILDEITPSEMEEKKAEMEGKTEEEENFYCSEWNKVGFRCDVGQCEKCAKEEGKKTLKGWGSNKGLFSATLNDNDPTQTTVFPSPRISLTSGTINLGAIIDLSKHYEGEGL